MYVTANESKRLKLVEDGGREVGKPASLDKQDAQLLTDVIRRSDRGNEPKSLPQIVDIIQELNPALDRKAARHAFTTVQSKRLDELTGKVKAQATTTARSAITVPQQFRWHTLIDDMYAEIVRLNTEEGSDSVPDSWRDTFYMVMAHFFLNGDETCMMAKDGRIHIIGDKNKKKHETNLDDSRVSITAFRCGTFAGTDGPTGFALKGEKVKRGYTRAFLVKHGAAEGSCIVMTPNAFMTEEGWDTMMDFILPGIRLMPHIVDHPNWWTFLSLDGWGKHATSLKTLLKARGLRVMVAKEEGDSSQVNQPYDGEVAIQDKSMGRDLLSLLRTSTGITRGIVDQYGLVHVVLEILSADGAGTAWERSAIRCNMHPNHRVPFDQWVESLIKRGVLQSGDNFKCEGEVNKYFLLPAFWRGMEPGERQRVASIVKHNDWDVQCLQRLHSECGLPYADMQKVRVCCNVAEDNRESLQYPSNMPAPQHAHAAPPAHAQLVAEASATKGVINFTRCPVGLKGQPLLDHQILFAKRRLKKGEKLQPSAHLDVEVTVEQELLFNRPIEDLTIRKILRDAGGDGAVKKMAQRKLDSVAFVNAYCCYANSEVRIKRFKQAARLAASIAEIQRLTIGAEEEKKQLEADLMADTAPGALKKLRSKSMDFASITVKELTTIAYVY